MSNKRKQSMTLEENLERLCKKIKKLEKKIRSRDAAATVAAAVPPEQHYAEDPPEAPESPERLDQYGSAPPETGASSSDDHYEEPEPADNDAAEVEPPITVADDLQPVLDSESPTDHPTSLPPPEAVAKDKEDKSNDEVVTNAATASEPTELDEDILAILGEDPSSTIKYGPDIRKELASRFQHMATEGLSKESRKELVNKYLLPANCLHVGAPTINPEIKVALNENTIKRDKGIEAKQKEMASAISCLTELITLQINCKEKNNLFLQKLMDIGRILCDIQHGDSVTRRNFILFTVKNDMQEHLKNTKIDTYLFGEQLSDTLKSAKAVNKSGAELKLDSNKNIPKKAKPQVSQTLNRKAAPPRRQAGAAAQAHRGREPAYPRMQPQRPPLQTPAPAYRMSLPQPPPPPRRRY